MKNKILILITFILISCSKKVENFDLSISNSNYELNLKNGYFKINWYNNWLLNIYEIHLLILLINTKKFNLFWK